MAKNHTHEEMLEVTMKLCDKLIELGSVKQAAHAVGIAPSTFFLWTGKHSDISDLYTRAREMRADIRYETIDEVVQDMRNGIIDAQQARVQIDTIKWQCGKEKARMYGDSTQIKHADYAGNKLGLTSILGEIDGRSTGIPSD